MAKKPKPRVATNDESSLAHHGLAGLGALRAAVPDGDAAPPPATVDDAAEAPPEDLRASGKIVVRREKKGRGGKATTVIEGLRVPAAQLETLARRLRKTLGCGAHVEGATVVLQGAQTDRVAAWLRGHGAPRVIVGN